MNKTAPHTVAIRERLAPRHNPKQDRSRARFQALLDAAGEVIGEAGLQGLAMREVARRADLPIASVYHYFPSTASLIRALLEQQFDKLNGILEIALQRYFPAESETLNFEHVALLIDEIAAFFFNTPSVPELWAGLYAYPDLRALNIEDTKRNAAMLEPVISRYIPSAEPQQVSATAIVLVECVSATLRLATASTPDVGARLVDALKTFVTLSLMGLMKADPSNLLSKQVDGHLSAPQSKQNKKPASRGKRRS